MDEIKQIKLFRLIFYDIATLAFFLGALIRMCGVVAEIVNIVYMVCASFYLLGAITDTILYVKERNI